MTKKLPIGIQTFADIQQGNYYYVDKTPHILELLKKKYIFLSRPRRFGKSLMLDTIAELFSANKPLFTGLYAEKHWDWSQKHPVLRFGFTEGEMNCPEKLIREIHSQLRMNEEKHQIAVEANEDLHERFRTLIDNLAEREKSKVVILVDEYDKPILDSLTNTETALT